MSAGGINVQQPLAGAPPTGYGSAPPAGSGQLAPVTAGSPNPAYPVSALPASATNTAFVPVDGQQAGSANGGGMIQDGSLGRTAAIAGGIAATGVPQSMERAAAAQQLASQSVAGPTANMAPAGQASAPRGPAAWNEAWAKKFKDVGASAEIIQQLTFTGAMGADEAQLQQIYDQVKGEIDAELAKFQHAQPDAFKKLRGNKDVDRATILQIASMYNAGQLKKEQLDPMVEAAGKSMFEAQFAPILKSFALYGLIPGWGLLRVLTAPLNGGKEIWTDMPIFGDPMTTTFSILGAVGGGFTIYNNIKGAMHVAAGHAAVRAGGDAFTIAQREGLDQLSLGRKAWSFVPGTKLNQQFGFFAGMDDIKAGIAAMTPGSLPQQIAQSNYNKIVSGEVLAWRDSASKFMAGPIPGYQPNSRGIIMGHIMGNKGAIQVQTHGSRPTIHFDGRTTGKVAAAHLATLVELVDDVPGANGVRANLRTELFAGRNSLDPKILKTVRAEMLGQAGQQLLDAEKVLKGSGIARPTGIQAIMAKIRPGAVMDAIVAADNLAKGPSFLDKTYGWKAIPKLGRIGIGVGVVGTAGYFMFAKPMLDQLAEAKKEAAKQAEQQGQAGAGGQMSAQDQQMLQQFAALPKDKQAQIIQEMTANLQRAAQTPNLTAEQQQQLVAAQAEIQLLTQVANGQMPTAGAGAASGSATGGAAQVPAAATAPASAPSPGAAPQFTAQGLGLAG